MYAVRFEFYAVFLLINRSMVTNISSSLFKVFAPGDIVSVSFLKREI